MLKDKDGNKFYPSGAVKNMELLKSHISVASKFFKTKANGLFKMLTSFFTRGR